jgi:hypothetical protein
MKNYQSALHLSEKKSLFTVLTPTSEKFSKDAPYTTMSYRNHNNTGDHHE